MTSLPRSQCDRQECACARLYKWAVSREFCLLVHKSSWQCSTWRAPVGCNQRTAGTPTPIDAYWGASAVVESFAGKQGRPSDRMTPYQTACTDVAAPASATPISSRAPNSLLSLHPQLHSIHQKFTVETFHPKNHRHHFATHGFAKHTELCGHSSNRRTQCALAHRRRWLRL